MPSRRLFYAFWPDDAARSALERSRAALFPLAGRPVVPESLHVTAAFLGEVDEARLPALQALAGPVAPFALQFDRLAHWTRPRVLVALTTQPPPQLGEAIESLWRRLDRLGFAREPRPYRAHITLVRDCAALPTRATWTPAMLEVRSLVLAASPRSGGHAGYERIA